MNPDREDADARRQRAATIRTDDGAGHVHAADKAREQAPAPGIHTPQWKANMRAAMWVNRHVFERMPFEQRGLSARCADALVTHGIDAPERLLFMTEAELRAVPGIGKAAMAEIAAYRSRFLP
jgi:DNA-directed RNA polymerase alpha subunit